MSPLTRLFGRSPFAPLQTHMDKVAVCVKKLVPLFEALKQQDFALLAVLAKEISRLENEADLTKNEIRNHLPSTFLLPVSRVCLLEVLALQDCIADRAEDTAILLTFRNLELVSIFEEELFAFLKHNLATFDRVFEVVGTLGTLLESSFGGREAESTKQKIERVAFFEHECDIFQRLLLKKLFGSCAFSEASVFFLWDKIIGSVGALSNESEKLANRVRMMLDIK